MCLFRAARATCNLSEMLVHIVFCGILLRVFPELCVNCDCPELLLAEFVMVRGFCMLFCPVTLTRGWLSLVEPDFFFKADDCLTICCVPATWLPPMMVSRIP